MKSSIITGLKTALESITVENGFSATVNSVDVKHRETDFLMSTEKPAINIVEDGVEFRAAEDETNVLWVSRVMLFIITAGNIVTSEKNNVLESVKSKIHSRPTIDADVREIRIEAIEDIDTGDTDAVTAVALEIIYTQAVNSAPTGSNNVYGSVELLETVASKIQTQLDSLKTAMSGFDTKFDYVLPNHANANVRLNSLTYEVAGADFENIGLDTTGQVTLNKVDVSIRAHTGFSGGRQLSTTSRRLIDSVHSWFKSHTDLGGDYRYWQTETITGQSEFTESFTTGGEIVISVLVPTTFAQV